MSTQPSDPLADPLAHQALPMQPHHSDDGDAARKRLALSRERISMWLTDDPRDPTADPRSTNARSTNDSTAAHNVLDTHSMGSIAADVLNEWWHHHPLNASGRLAGAAARGIVEPLVRKHPVVALGVAAATGALLVRSQAWRWVLRRALVVGAASQVASKLMSRAADQVDSAARHSRATQHFNHDN